MATVALVATDEREHIQPSQIENDVGQNPFYTRCLPIQNAECTEAHIMLYHFLLSYHLSLAR